MKTKQYLLNASRRLNPSLPDSDASVGLVLVFGSRPLLDQELAGLNLAGRFPSALITGCSTSGEIRDTEVTDETMVITTISADHCRFYGTTADIRHFGSSADAGESLIAALPKEGLRHVFVLSDGLNVNGSELVRGLNRLLPSGVSVTGGLAGDSDRFETSRVIWNGLPHNHLIAAVGWYGEPLKIGYGSLGGWDPFGPERVVTRSAGNKLYDLDGRNALNIYKTYLGEQANHLPGSALLFPLSLKLTLSAKPVVRTVLSIDETDQSMTFAGDVPVGAYTQMMKANFDRLIDGASGAAEAASTGSLQGTEPELAILISCVGRKMVLGQRIEEEVEAVRDTLGLSTTLTGFYSYGEISPFTPDATCELHNQTMTITTFSER
ncbi:MAG: FIST C-terminal domain-containing protein [Bacteroidetes bacterium]|nr:FIST C-terminal domain-containing protein [Bacteroidota bacterium]